ncbi:MAG: [FeFe] hydrogenase H-cluster radical SAM maturase HydE [Coriobacteriaceae bacterium]
MLELVDKLARGHGLSPDEYAALIDARTPALADELAGRAREVCEAVYGDGVFARGLIEFTNICANDCYYCGIRRSNRACERYRLTREQILACAEEGWQAGFRTFVLQGGEDPGVTDEWLAELIGALKAAHPGCAVTLSVGERSRESYECLRAAGADRYLLRHETATAAHYRQLHPAAMTLQRRMACLSALREAGFAVGAGFMVGSPFQTTEHLAADLAFIQEFRPEMCGIGPFVPHRDTLCRRGTRHGGAYLLPAVPRASGASDGAAAGYHGPGSAGSPQPREGHPRWRQRRDAELVPPERQGDYALYDGKPARRPMRPANGPTWRRGLSPGRRLVEDRGDPAAAWASVVGPAAASVVSPARGAVVLAAVSRPVSAAAATASGSSSAASFPSTFPLSLQRK